jgi:hypothetical protein
MRQLLFFVVQSVLSVESHFKSMSAVLIEMGQATPIFGKTPHTFGEYPRHLGNFEYYFDWKW